MRGAGGWGEPPASAGGYCEVRDRRRRAAAHLQPLAPRGSEGLIAATPCHPALSDSVRGL